MACWLTGHGLSRAARWDGDAVACLQILPRAWSCRCEISNDAGSSEAGSAADAPRDGSELLLLVLTRHGSYRLVRSVAESYGQASTLAGGEQAV